MKRLVTSLLLIPLLAFGMADRRKQTAPTPTNTSTLDLATGQLTTSDYSGQSQSAAGNSRIADTGASGVATAFAGKSDPTMELAWFDINRAAEDQPDVAIDLQLANEHKSAVENVRQVATSPNISVAALDFAKEGLKAVQAKIAAREREKAARGKADTSAFRATAYLQGPGAVTSVAVMAGTMGAAVANGNEKRATYQSSINEKQIDTSNTNDYAGVNAALRTKLEMTKLELEIAKLKQAVTPAKPTPPVEEVDDDTPGEEPTSSVEYDKLPKKNFIYKTRLEKRNPVTRHDAAILIPKDRPAPVSIDGIGHEIVENYLSKSEDRWLLRTKGPLTGSAATLVVTYKDGSKESFKIKALNSRTEYAPGAFKKSGDAEPVDPPPSTSSLFILEPDRLTLRPDFAAVVRNVDAMANVTHPNIDPIFIDAGKVGPYTWGIPKPLGSYPKSVQVEGGPKAMPNTWRLSLVKGAKIPADVTYHTSIMQTFIQDGATKTYPPTTRE